MSSVTEPVSPWIEGKMGTVLARIQANWLKVLLLFSLCCGCFAYGLGVGLYKIFPYSTIRDAQTASLALIAVTKQPDLQLIDELSKHVLVPTVQNDSRSDANELILVSGGLNYLSTFHESGCVAWLMDRRGDIKHVWKHDPSVWDDLETVTQVLGISEKAYPVGIHLYDNGDLLVNYQGFSMFPFGVGIARYDKNSKLLWKKELMTHHWFTVADDGRIYVPALHVVDAPIPVGETGKSIGSATTKINNDVVLILDENGNVLDEIPMLDAIIDSGWGGLLSHAAAIGTDDPVHLNDVQIVDAKLAESQSWLSRGDLLVSFRNINSIGILDPTTQRFKWMSSGAVIAQHSPRFFEHGVLVLDNQGGNVQQGGTQLVKISERGTPMTVFPQLDAQLPERCHTINSGHLDVNQNGHSILLTLTHDGAVWEIDARTGEVTWEYIYVHPNEDGMRRPIYTAKYVYEANFSMNGDKR